MKSTVIDYLSLYLALSIVAGKFWYGVPLFMIGCLAPRRIAILKYYTFHAELMPHTEQVVFLKANIFGQIQQHMVDIKNLEKIDVSEVTNQLMFVMNIFDSKMIFRD